MAEGGRAVVTAQVLEFYRSMPFNLNGTVAQACRMIRERHLIAAAYPPLHARLQSAAVRRVLEVGCGTGWFANAAAYHYPADVTAVDLCDAAIARAREVSQALGLSARVRYLCADLFELSGAAGLGGASFDLVNSLGVAHHTDDCRGAVQTMTAFVKPGGLLHLGLYHAHGRKPFLELFGPMRTAWRAAGTDEGRRAAERAGLEVYRELNPAVTDEVMLQSWFRDQVLHPHESHHTFEEVYGWLRSWGWTCLATSINRFEPVADWTSLFGAERQMSQLSYALNVQQRRYFPGFFVVLAQRPAGASGGGP